VFHEKDRAQAIRKAREFVVSLFESTPQTPSLLDADKCGFTFDEHQQLKKPLPALSLRGISFAVQRLVVNTVARLSKGVRLGREAGFDSGRTLDYVYANQPQGSLGLGKLIDRTYLNAIGWRGIRQRKVNLKRTLKRAIDETVARGRPVRLLDIASGPGRYVLETLQELRHVQASAVLRDFQAQNVASARKLVDEMQLANVTIEQGDAFDEESVAAVRPQPTVAVVSGLYELFPDNGLLCRSLRGLHRALEPDGFLIYTNQPWHPQLEMIARVLTSHRGGVPWIMRRRTQAEMDELVADAGFDKLEMEIDRWGIFTVSLARRRSDA
jgi:SAM-dependent methyltransferase